MDLYKERLLSILIDFDVFLKQNDVCYSLEGGTLLGAIRHSGFIPWDDDIDIVLNKENYYKLLDVIGNFNSDKYAVVLPMTTKLSAARMIKIYDKTMTIKEKNCDFYEGPFVDVFTTIDCRTNSKLLNKVYFGIYRFFTSVYDIKNGRTNSKKIGTLTSSIQKMCSLCFSVNALERIIKSFYQYDGGNNCFCTTSFGSPHQYKKLLFDNHIQCCFEGFSFPIMMEYEEYLKITYGDYMELPPVEERVEHHLDFVDFDIPFTCYIDDASDSSC